MTTINLLPWREESREQRRKAFLGKLIAAALLGIVLVFLWISVAQARLDNQNSRNSYLQSNIAEMDKKVAEISELKRKAGNDFTHEGYSGSTGKSLRDSQDI